MQILIVTGAFPVRSQSFIEAKVVALARRGHTVTVLAGGFGDHPLDPGTVAALGDRLQVQYRARGRSSRTLLRSARMVMSAAARDPDFSGRLVVALARRHRLGPEFWRRLHRGLFLAAHRPDVVHFEWVTKAAECSEVLGLLPAVTVVSCRGSDVQVIAPCDGRLAGELPRVFARADAVHCVSSAVVDAAVQYGLDRAKAFINHPAVDCERFSASSPAAAGSGTVRIISVGRLHWIKGYEYALQAVRLLLDQGHDVHYTVVGGGNAEGTAAVKAVIDDLRLEPHVTLSGAQPSERVRDALAESHLLLLSSLSEGLSNSVLEGMAMELPVVVTDVGGMGELVRDGVDGYLTPSRDPATMADRLSRLVVDPEQRSRMGAAGRARVCKSFSLPAQIDAFVAEYRELLARRAPPGCGTSPTDHMTSH